MAEIANKLDVSYHKVVYWMQKYHIKRRSRSKAAYLKANPYGDPFEEKDFILDKISFLKGLGIGFYWGEGTKADKHSIRIANSDPDFIKLFLKFLEEIYNIDRKKLKFGLHLFNDVDSQESIEYWMRQLNVKEEQFHKPQIVKVRGEGTYSKKSQFGVLTIYFNNKKLRDIIISEIESLKCSRS